MISIDAALLDKNLLGAALGDHATFTNWLAVLRSAYALPMSNDDRAVFAQVAGGREPPPQRVDELWAVVGRRGGKSRVAAALAVHAACFLPHQLAFGEIGEVAIVAASRSQAAIVFQYVRGFLEASPILRREIESFTADEVRLRGNIVIAVRTGSYRTVRGRTLILAILDECAFFRDEASTNPDVEVYRAILPALATTHGLLVGISTPYRRSGLLHQKHRDHFGVNDPHVLVVVGPTKLFNPTIDQRIVARAIASDPEGARAEWDAEFRSDIAAFLDDETIDAAIDHSRPLELPPRKDIKYVAFTDPSGGRHDAFTLAIGHSEVERYICDVIRGTPAPFNPSSVVEEYAALLRSYNVREVVGDNYSAAWSETAFKEADITYTRSEMNKSQLYLEALAPFMRGAVSLPDHPKLIRELRLLERRTSRVGKDIVDHGRNGSDDHANALAGMLRSLAAPRYAYDATMSWVDDFDDPESDERWRMMMYHQHLLQR